jgi:hypothetical protein
MLTLKKKIDCTHLSLFGLKGLPEQWQHLKIPATRQRAKE